MNRNRKLRALLTCLATLCVGALPCGVVQSDEWPQWMGPTGDGIYYEKGLVDSIPANGIGRR